MKNESDISTSDNDADSKELETIKTEVESKEQGYGAIYKLHYLKCHPPVPKTECCNKECKSDSFNPVPIGKAIQGIINSF